MKILCCGRGKKTINPIQKIEKNGLDYENEKKNIRPFDLVLFRGSDFVSSAIRRMSKAEMGGRYEAGQFSHVGMIVTRDVLDIPELEPGKLYVWESTVSGKLGGDVTNIDGKAFLGVQIRDFDAVMRSYDNSPKTAVAYSSLIANPIDSMPCCCIKTRMEDLYQTNNGKVYEINISDLFAAMFPKLRFIRSRILTDKFLFCSELVTLIYNSMRVFKETNIRPENVVPADFVSEGDVDGYGLPRYFNHYKFITMHPKQ